jgi:hypothetical protein
VGEPDGSCAAGTMDVAPTTVVRAAHVLTTSSLRRINDE